MAKSGTIWGSFSGKSTSIARPYIVWEAANPNITNNTTLVTAKLYFVRYDGYRSYDNNGQNFTVTLDGTATTQNQPYDIGPNGASDLIMTVSKTVTHNSDGTKTITISASGNTNNSSLGSVSVSGSVTLDTIPRASSFTAFTLSNTVLNTSTATTINYTLDKKSTSFTDYLTLKYGSKTIASWSTTGEGALTRTLTAAEVNSIIVAMPNSTSGTLTLTNQTKNGSTNVGSTTSINEGISLNAAIKPTATGLTASIYGTGRDKTIGKYVQSISKVTASFTGTAGYGATESANTIVVRRQSDDANSQTITGESGTTANPVTLSGVYEIIATAKDSRGRSTTQTITITVEAYSAPKITTFTAKRNATTSTTVDATINVSWSALGTSNPTDVVVVGKNNAGVSTTHYNLVDSTAGALNTTQSYTGQSDASSYTYTITLTDSFGKTASATVSVSTSFIEMTIAKGKGIGVGKVHESGAIDANGDIRSNLQVTVTNPLNPSATIHVGWKDNMPRIRYGGSGDGSLNGFEIQGPGDVVKLSVNDNGALLMPGGITPIRVTANTNLNDYTAPGLYYCPLSADAQSLTNSPTTAAFSLFVERHAGQKQTITEYGTGLSRTYRRNAYSGSWGAWKTVGEMDRGSNSNGDYIRFQDGTQICWQRIATTSVGLTQTYGDPDAYIYHGTYTWTYPAAFNEVPTVQCSEFKWGTGASWGSVSSTPTSTAAVLRGHDPYNRASGTTVNISAIAIGRWA